MEFQCEIIGDGPDRISLERLWRDLGLEDTVTFAGARPNIEVMNRYVDASIFDLPCVIASNNDRDGIPNVLLEAMANELPIISTPISGIPEVLEHGEVLAQVAAEIPVIVRYHIDLDRRI